MKFLTRVKIFFKKLSEKLMPVNNIDKLNMLLSKQKKVLADTRQKYYNSKGKEEYYTTEIATNQKLKQELLDSAKKCKEKNDSNKLKQVFDMYDLTENRITMYSSCLEKQKEITTKLNQFVSITETKINKLNCDIEMLKTKDEFSQSVRDLRSIQCDQDDINVDDVVKDIEIDYNARVAEFTDMNVEDISGDLNRNKFEDFVKGL